MPRQPPNPQDPLAVIHRHYNHLNRVSVLLCTLFLIALSSWPIASFAYRDLVEPSATDAAGAASGTAAANRTNGTSLVGLLNGGGNATTDSAFSQSRSMRIPF